MATNENILWIDLETSGSDEKAHHLLEVGAILTDQHLDTLDSFTRVVVPDRPFEENMPGVVMKMHQANNLLDDVFKAGFPAWQVDREMVAWLREHGVDTNNPVPVAGSGVLHFDRRWISVHLKQTAKRLKYWGYDVGVIRRFLRLAGVEVPDMKDTKPHRALEDIYLHLLEGRHFLRQFKELT